MTAVALGNFDGVHIAHKAVLEKAAEFENSICLLFNEHPLKVISGKSPKLILSAENTESKIRHSGIKKIVYLNFSDIKDYTPSKFFDKIILTDCKADTVVCGYNYTFGKNKSGNAELLKEFCEKSGVKFFSVPEIEYESLPISSTRIRRAIESGEIEKANEMLGYEFFYNGKIETGKRLGRTLGFPTINQYFGSETVKPLSGVYLSEVTLLGEKYMGLTNIGSNPTIGTDNFRSETFIFDFNGEVYGENAYVSLKNFIRPEKKFSSVEELRQTVQNDIERARRKGNV